MGKGRTLVRGTLLLTLSGLGLRGLGLLFQSLLARRVGAAGMGLLQLVLTVGGFAGALGSAGARVAALQLTARAWGREDGSAAAAALEACLRYALRSSALAGGALLLLAGPISALLLHEARTTPALRLLGLLLPCPILAGTVRAAYTACGRVRELVAVELAERLLSLGLTLPLLAAAGQDPGLACMAVIGGSYGAGAFSFLLLWRRLRRDLPPPGALPAVARTALPLGLNDWLRAGLGAVEQFLIPWGLARSGSRDGGLAAYGVISGMVFPLLWFPAEGVFALSELLVSELARLAARGDRDRVRALIRKSLALTALLALTVAAGLWLGGGVLGRVLYGSPMAGRFLRIFAPLALFLYPDAVVDGLQKGLGQQLHLVRYNSLTNVMDVLGLWLLLPRCGIWGYLFTYCLSHLVNFFLSLRRLLVAAEQPEQGL